MPLAVCATPIGNLADVTLRVLDELREADAVLCEDTRRTQILLERHGIRRPPLVRLPRHSPPPPPRHPPPPQRAWPRGGAPAVARGGRAARARLRRRPPRRERPRRPAR